MLPILYTLDDDKQARKWSLVELGTNGKPFGMSIRSR